MALVPSTFGRARDKTKAQVKAYVLSQLVPFLLCKPLSFDETFRFSNGSTKNARVMPMQASEKPARKHRTIHGYVLRAFS